MAVLHMTVKGVSSSQDVMSADVKEMCQQLSDLTNLVMGVLSSTAAHSASDLGGAATLGGLVLFVVSTVPTDQLLVSLLTFAHLVHHFAASNYAVCSSHPIMPIPHQFVTDVAGPQRTFPACPSNFPQGLLILNVPVLHVDGLHMPKSDSWKDIMHHWMEGEPQLGLCVALKDWPHHYYNGQHGQQFNSKYYQQSVVTTEFLNEFKGNKEAFIKAYGTATHEGHTKLLKAILAAHKHYCGDRECHHNLANEVCDPPLNTLLNSNHEL
ncbi:hypothetical protein EDC04DRAFT_2905608 [Pisolithus marmoratus]|nr:hypothetical protein EDC04DRAFT_2905608 [Pisolithus marmoratus]